MTIGCNFANNCYWSWFECSGSWRRSLCMMWKCKLWTGSFSSFYQFLPGWPFSCFSLYFWGIFHQILHTVLPPKVGGVEIGKWRCECHISSCQVWHVTLLKGLQLLRQNSRLVHFFIPFWSCTNMSTCQGAVFKWKQNSLPSG